LAGLFKYREGDYRILTALRDEVPDGHNVVT
jgi:hypothetical protein